MTRFGFLFLLLLSSIVLLPACGSDKTEVASVKVEPDSLKITMAKPVSFPFKIEEAGKHTFSIDFTYFTQQMQGLDSVLFSGVLNGGGSHWRKNFTVVFKGDKGWVGEPLNAEKMDYKTTIELGDEVELQAGEYNFILSPVESPQKDILGMVELTLKVLK
jgi:hypothetical protein